MDAVTGKEKFADGNEPEELSGCPLEKILEFLETVMTKDYKKALILAKEVEKHEPNNELVLEYMTVLQQIVLKEEENDNAQGSDSDTNESSSDEAGEYSEELTTSSETDSVSEEGNEESSTEESHSSTSTSEDSDEDEEEHEDELEGMKHSDGDTLKEDVIVVEEESEKAAESLDDSICRDCGEDDK